MTCSVSLFFGKLRKKSPNASSEAPPPPQYEAHFSKTSGATVNVKISCTFDTPYPLTAWLSTVYGPFRGVCTVHGFFFWALLTAWYSVTYVTYWFTVLYTVKHRETPVKPFQILAPLSRRNLLILNGLAIFPETAIISISIALLLILFIVVICPFLGPHLC